MSSEGKLPAVVRLLVVAVVLGGTAILAWRAGDVAGWTGDDVFVFLVLAAAIAVADQFPIALRHGTETEYFVLTDAVWVAALLLTGPSVLTISVAAGEVIGQSMRRWAPHKVAFNTGGVVIAITAAGLVYGALDPPSASEPEAWLAATAGMAAFLVVNTTTVALAIALVQGESFRRVLLTPLRINVIHWAGNVSIGILGALVWVTSPAALPLLVLPLMLLYVAYRGWLRSMKERDQMHEMAWAADTISEQGDLTTRLPEPGTADDVGVLAATLNRMLDRLEGAFDRERRFIIESSHELRTPITICRGYLEVLGSNPAPAEVKEAIAVVLDELGRMGRLVEDLTTLARMEDPQFVRPEPVALEAFASEVAVKAERLLDGRLRIQPVPKDAVVLADPQRLTQALMNLLQNAAVHTLDGGPVDLRFAEEPSAWRFEVADRGGGLPRGLEEALFQPFRRGKGSAPGSGLGLAIVRGIAEAHGGSAGVDNHPGRGVTFWIRVPR